MCSAKSPSSDHEIPVDESGGKDIWSHLKQKTGFKKIWNLLPQWNPLLKSPACEDLRDAREPHRRKKIVNSIKFEASRAYTDLCSTETDTYRLHPAAVVGPVQQGLALFAPAIQVAGRAVFLQLSYVPAHGFPAFDLSFIIGAASSHVVAAIPLKPAAGIIGVDPALGDPVGERF